MGWNQEGTGFNSLYYHEIPGINEVKQHYASTVDFIKKNFPSEKMGYALIDIDRNGTREFLAGRLDDPAHIYILGVYDGQDDANSSGTVIHNYSEGPSGYELGRNEDVQYEFGMLPGNYVFGHHVTGSINDQDGVMDTLDYCTDLKREDSKWVIGGGYIEFLYQFNVAGTPSYYYSGGRNNEEYHEITKTQYDSYLEPKQFLSINYRSIDEF